MSQLWYEDRAVGILHVTVEVEGERHHSHTHQEEWQHGEETEYVPQSSLPAGVVRCGRARDRIGDEISVVFWATFLHG